MTQRRVKHLRSLPSSPLSRDSRAWSKLGHGCLLIKFAADVSSDETSDLLDPLLQRGFDLIHALRQFLPEVEEQLLLILQSPLDLVKGSLKSACAALYRRYGRDLVKLREDLRLPCD